jgi:hypothetical protein
MDAWITNKVAARRVSGRCFCRFLDGIAVGTAVAFGLGTALGIVVAVIFDVVVVVDVAGEVLVVVVTPLVHPATNTVANTLVIINMIKNCFFIVILSFEELFSQLKVLLKNNALCDLIRSYVRVL